LSELTLQIARKIDPRRVSVVFVAIWSVFAVVGLVVGRGYGRWGLQTFNPQHSSLDLQLSTTATVTGVLMLLAAGMAFALTRVDRSRRSRTWFLAAAAFAALGLEELLGVHTWLVSEGASWGVGYLPVLLFGLAGLVGAVRILGRQPEVQARFGLAIALWLAGALVDNPSFPGSGGASELCLMASAMLFSLALLERLRFLAAEYYPLDEAETRLSIDEIATELLGRINIRRLAIGSALIAAALAIQYILFHKAGYPHCPAALDHCHARDAEKIGILDLNNEQTLAATFQASLLLIAGGLALAASRLRTTRAAMKPWFAALGVAMLFLTADQILAVHSRFQDSTGVTGQLILLPIAIVAVVAWWKVLQEISDNRLARTLFIAGAAFWAYSQASDVLLDPIQSFSWTTTPEETGETTGSMLWMLALLVWLRDRLNLSRTAELAASNGSLEELRLVREPAPTG
jgi:hypothetical protein